MYFLLAGHMSARIASVGVGLEFVGTRGLLKRGLGAWTEQNILYGKTATEPLLLIMRADVEYGVFRRESCVEVGCRLKHLKAVVRHHHRGVIIKEGTVGLKMNQTSGSEHTAVHFDEARAGEALVHFLHLRVGKRNPYFRHLARGKKFIKQLDRRTYKRHILHVVAHSGSGTAPDACTLDVDAYEILVGETAAKSYGVLAFAAAELENYRVFVMKKIFVPAAAKRKTAIAHTAERILKNERIILQLGEFTEFVFSHLLTG